jgi:haloalkane dehalogenase
MALIDYPFTGHRFRHRNGLSQHFLDEGQGAPVLMLHGNPTWSYYYRHLVLGLRDTHRCLVPDHIGMGWSDKPDDSKYSFSLEERVDDLDALTDHWIAARGVPETGWTLVVHDWGGMIGFAYACRHPERFSRFVVLNTGAFPLPPEKRLPFSLFLGRDTTIGAVAIHRFNAFARGATRMAVMKPLSAAERAAYLAPYDTAANRLATLRFVQDIPLTERDRGYAVVAATAARLVQFADRPMQIHWGMKDFVFDHHFLAEFRRYFPDADVHEYANAGHYVLDDERAAIVAAVREFLARA